MRKETDLEGVKSTARMLLMTEVHKTPYSPMVVQHPFTSTGVVALPTEGTEPMELLDITADKDSLARWQEFMKKQIDRADHPYHIYSMVNNPYGLTFLKHTAPYLSQEDFSQILASAWILCEAPHNDPDVGIQKLVSMFRDADPATLMDEEEYAQFQELEDTVTVYRGVTTHNAKNVKALSWTLNRETAEWFAHRFDEDGTVYEAQIDKQHILALFNGRNESEVIVDPKYLTDITEAQEQSSAFNLSQ